MLALIYIVDELTSNISSSIQPEVITDFFVMGQGIDYNIGLSNLALMSLPANIIILVLPFYKALADRLGRRLFLFINTIGMGMGMLICMVAPNIYIYIVGLLVIKFFIPNDVQVMYIMESAPEQHRAKLCSMTKTIAYALLEHNTFYLRDGVHFVRARMDGGSYTEKDDTILPLP